MFAKYSLDDNLQGLQQYLDDAAESIHNYDIGLTQPTA